MDLGCLFGTVVDGIIPGVVGVSVRLSVCVCVCVSVSVGARMDMSGI